MDNKQVRGNFAASELIKHQIINDMKQIEKYLSPETKIVFVSLGGSILNGSAKGYTDDPSFDNSGWGLD